MFANYTPLKRSNVDGHGTSGSQIAILVSTLKLGMTQLRRSRRCESTPEVFAAWIRAKSDHSRVSDAPFEEPKSVPAPLAPKGINVKEAHQTFKTDATGSLNIFARAFGTNSFRNRGG